MTKRTHYVNNADFFIHLVEYKKKYNEAIKKGKQPSSPSNYIGECLMKIAQNMSTKRNFVNYPFRDEMVSDAIENCITYLHKFDEKKYNNPFAYFSQMTYFAFLRRIKKEKELLVRKAMWVERENLNGSQVADITGTPSFEEFGNLNIQSEMGSEWTKEYMNGIVQQHHDEKAKKKARAKPKPKSKVKRVAKKAAKKVVKRRRVK